MKKICEQYLFFRRLNDSVKIQGNKYDKYFFFYPQKSINEGNKKLVEQLINECEKLVRQCDELKVNNHYVYSCII